MIFAADGVIHYNNKFTADPVVELAPFEPPILFIPLRSPFPLYNLPYLPSPSPSFITPPKIHARRADIFSLTCSLTCSLPKSPHNLLPPPPQRPLIHSNLPFTNESVSSIVIILYVRLLTIQY